LLIKNKIKINIIKMMKMSFLNTTTYTGNTTVVQPKQQTNYTGTQTTGNNFMNLQGIKSTNCSSCSGHR
jgi:hypothetical protein